MNGLNLDESLLLKQYRQTKDLQIERLLSQYGTSLKDMRELYPQLTDTIKQRQLTTTFPTQPLFFTPSEAQQMGLGLEEGWMLKMTPTEGNGGFTSSLITPEKWEITENDLYISPSGDQLSRADMEALLGEPTGAFEATPQALTIENLTEEGKSAYQEYQQAGGGLDVKGWVDLRERQQLETEEIFGAVFPQQDIDEVIDYMNENREAFLADIREIGPTEDVIALLKAIPFDDGQGNTVHLTDAEIQELFGTTVMQLFAGAVIEESPPLEPWSTMTTALYRRPEDYTVKDYFRVLGRSLLKLPKQIGATILQAIQGQGGASVVNKDWADKFITEASEDLDKFVQDITKEHLYAPTLIREAAVVSRNLAYSITSMGAGAAVGVPVAFIPLPGARVAAWAAGTAASGVVAYQMTTYQIMQEYLEVMNEQQIQQTGKGLTLEEENKLKQDFHDLAVRYGLWEAIPEAISNLAFAQILGGPLGKMIGGNLATKIIGKIVGIYGEELLTETITQKGQSDIEVEAGLREKRISWVEAFKEIAPQTFLLTTIMAGAGQVIVSSSQAINKVKASLRNEVGEGNPLYDEIQEGIETELPPILEAAQEEYWEEHPEIKRPSIEPVIPDLAEGMLQDMRVADEIAKKGVPEAETVTRKLKGSISVSYEKLIEGAEIQDTGLGEQLRITFKTREELDAWANERGLVEHRDYQVGEHYQGRKAEGGQLLDATLTIDSGRGLELRDAKDETIRKWYNRRATKTSATAEGITAKAQATTEIPTAEAGMPEAGLQPSMLEGVPAKEVRPQPTGKLVQARMDDYLRLREYNKQATIDRIAEIKKALETKGRSALGLKGNLRLELARLEALQGVDAVESITELDRLIKQVAEEIGLREMPYAGYGGKAHIDLLRSPTHRLFKGYSLRQLEEMLNVYNQARQNLSPEVPGASIIKAEDIPTDIPALTNTALTPTQIQKTLDLFKEAVAAPSAEVQRAAALELRKHIFAQRAKLAHESAEAMIAEGMNPEEAIRVAEQQFMTGKLPDVTTEYFSDLTQEMRNVLFAKVYNYWKDKSWAELISTHEALTNALAGKSIPRVKGIGTKYFPDGGSAWDRLARVFVGDMEVLEAIDQGKPLQTVIEGILLETGRGSVALDQQTVTWLKELSTISEEDKLLLTKPLSELTEVDVRRIAESWFYQRRDELNTLLKDGVISQEEYKLQLAIAKDRVFPYKPIRPESIPPSEWAAYNNLFEQAPMFTGRERNEIQRVLRGLGWTITDINNLMRGMMASFDASWPRQGKYLMQGHPAIGYKMWISFFKSFNTAEAEAMQERIMQDPLMELYEDIRKEYGYDFLRIMGVQKGTAQWRAAEEYGYPTSERLLPRITQKVTAPFERIFVTPLNVGTWTLYKDKYKEVMRYAEKVASGEVKLKEGESVNIRQEMATYQMQIGNLVQRASLGQYNKLGPILNTIFFAIRSKLGRFLFPLGLTGVYRRGGEWHFSRGLMKETWRDFMITNAEIAGVVLLGDFFGWWDVEKDPRNAEFMSIRIGNMRIDPWAGYRQFLVLYTRLATGTGVSSVTGAEYEADPVKALLNFFRSSLAPVPSILWDFWTGRNFLGVVVDLTNAEQWLKRIAPFAVQDIWEAFDEGTEEGMIAIIPAIFGEGVQTYTGDWRENWAKLGLPKYPENTGYGIYEPVYDLADFWADTASQLRGVDPATLTESKGYPEYVRSIAQALQIIDEMETLPNKRLTSLNADPEEGTTFVQYHQMWQERQKIVASGDEEALQAFDADERTRNAYLGNMTQAQYALLTEYHSLPESQKADFLGRHPELYANPREDWLRSHPEENALLVLWDKAKIYSLAALDKISSLAQSLGIPENAVATRDLDAVAQLKLKNKEQFDLLDAYSGLDDEFKGPDGLTARDIAIQELYADNPEFRDDMRRIEALNVGTDKNPTPDSIIEGWVERGQVVDEFGASSAETRLWLIDNKEVHQWALENGLLTDTGEDWNEDILRLQVGYGEDFDRYGDYGNAASPYYVSNDTARADAREAMLFGAQGMTSFGKAYYTIGALQKNIPENLVTTYVDYYGVRKKEGVDYSKTGWYDDDWYLIENKDFYDTMVDMRLWQERDFTKIPTREVFNLYQTYYTKHEGQERITFRIQHPELDAWLVYAKQYSYTSDAARDIYSNHPDKFLAYWPR